MHVRYRRRGIARTTRWLRPLIDGFMDGLGADLCIRHGMLRISDPSRGMFYILTGSDYASSGVDAKLPFVESPIEIAAWRGTTAHRPWVRMHLWIRAARAHAGARPRRRA